MCWMCTTYLQKYLWDDEKLSILMPHTHKLPQVNEFLIVIAIKDNVITLLQKPGAICNLINYCSIQCMQCILLWEWAMFTFSGNFNRKDKIQI